MASDVTANKQSTYNNGEPYRLARGQNAPRANVENLNTTIHPVVRGRPTAQEFIRAIVREMKIRCYKAKTIKQYRNALTAFLRWFGAAPHLVVCEDVGDYLELLVDGGGQSSVLSINLSAIRTAFDKMCGRQVILGLVTPRRPKRLPVVPSQNEMRRLLEAAPSLRDKLLIGLMYATGARVSEVVRLRWRDLDFDRRVVSIIQGKGAHNNAQPQSSASMPNRLELMATNYHLVYCNSCIAVLCRYQRRRLCGPLGGPELRKEST